MPSNLMSSRPTVQSKCEAFDQHLEGVATYKGSPDNYAYTSSSGHCQLEALGAAAKTSCTLQPVHGEGKTVLETEA